MPPVPPPPARRQQGQTVGVQRGREGVRDSPGGWTRAQEAAGAGLVCSRIAAPGLRRCGIWIYHQRVLSKELWGCFSVLHPHVCLGRAWPWSQPEREQKAHLRAPGQTWTRPQRPRAVGFPPGGTAGRNGEVSPLHSLSLGSSPRDLVSSVPALRQPRVWSCKCTDRQGYRRSTDEAPRQSLAESSFLLAGSSVLMWLPVYVGFGKSYGFSALQRGRCLKVRSSPWAHKDYVPQHPMQPTFPSIPGRLHFPASIVLGDSTDLVPPVGCKGSDPCSHISRVDPACSFPLWLWNEDHHPWRMC